MTLELGAGEELKTFHPQQRITTDFADRLIKEQNIYIKAQKELPESEQDRVYMANLKFLSIMYKDFDVAWVKENFNPNELREIKEWCFKGLLGIKNDEES